MMLLRPYYEKTFDRHYADIQRVERGEAPHLKYNESMAKKYILAVESLKHYKGVLAGKHVILEIWQKKMISIMMGWEFLNDNGKWVRRFSKALVFIPRKNGKTLLGSGLSIADMLIRGETGGEVVFFASKRDQAQIAWHGVEKMIASEPTLTQHYKKAYSTITYTKNDTTFKTLGRDSKAEDGANYSFGLADELHQHPDDTLINSVETSMGSREQPFLLIVTTAGTSLSSPLIPEYDYAKKVTDGIIEDDRYFSFIAEAPADVDPFSEEAFILANPNYGISVQKDFLKKQAKEAKERPEKYNNFLVKHLNRFTSQDEIFIPYDRWLECAAPKRDISKAKNIYIGLDLSLNDDFTAKATLYDMGDDTYHVKVKYFVPKDTIQVQERILKATLSKWVLEGYIEPISGDTIDLSYVKQDIFKQLDEENIDWVGYDPHRAKQLIKDIEDDGFENCVKIAQGYTSISEPTALLLNLVKQKKISHENDPVLNWMISNMSVKTNEYGNFKPDKSSHVKKIDGVAAVINCLWLVISQREEAPVDINGMIG